MPETKVFSLQEFQSKAETYKYVSFDLFDTLIFREYATLDNIKEASHTYLAKLIIDQQKGVNIDYDFNFLRNHYTALVKDSYSLATDEPTLRLVFEKIAISCGVEPAIAKSIAAEAVEFEVALDAANLSLMPGAVDLLQNLHDSAKDITLISDMYYEESHVRSILAGLGIEAFFNRVYVSATEKKTKNQGDLYRTVLDDIGVQSSELLHLGDNLKSDVKQAGSHGIAAIHLKTDSHDAADGQYDLTGKSVDELAVSASIAFVYEVFEKASRRGLSTLYFLSRDGFVFYDIAQELISSSPLFRKLSDGIDLRKLEVNRASGMFLELGSSENTFLDVLKKFDWYFEADFTLRDILHFFVQTKLANESLLEEFDNSLDTNLSGVGATVQRTRMLQDDALAERLTGLAYAHRERTFAYLHQEGVIGSGKIGMVDVGYTATLLRNVSSYLVREVDEQHQSSTQISTFLFAHGRGLHSNIDLSAHVANGVDGFIGVNDIPKTLQLNFSWLECFFRNANLGPLLAYHDENGMLKGEFKYQNDDASWLDATLERIQIDDSRVLRFFDWPHRVKIKRAFVQAMNKPTDETIKFVDSLTFGFGLSDHKLGSIVKKDLSVLDILPWRASKMAKDDVWAVGSYAAAARRRKVFKFFPLLLKVQLASKQKYNQLRERVMTKLKGYARRALKLARSR